MEKIFAIVSKTRQEGVLAIPVAIVVIAEVNPCDNAEIRINAAHAAAKKKGYYWPSTVRFEDAEEAIAWYKGDRALPVEFDNLDPRANR